MFIKYEPFSTRQRIIDVGEAKVPLPPFGLLAWATLTHGGLKTCPEDSVRFPVVIDPGFSHNLLIREESAVAWAGLAIHRTPIARDSWEGTVHDSTKQLLSREPNVEVEDASGRVADLPAFSACLWLHSNKPGKKPHRLPLSGGLAFYPAPGMPSDPVGPRLPLLGGFALHVGRLKLTVDYKNLTFSLSEQY